MDKAYWNFEYLVSKGFCDIIEIVSCDRGIHFSGIFSGIESTPESDLVSSWAECERKSVWDQLSIGMIYVRLVDVISQMVTNENNNIFNGVCHPICSVNRHISIAPTLSSGPSITIIIKFATQQTQPTQPSLCTRRKHTWSQSIVGYNRSNDSSQQINKNNRFLAQKHCLEFKWPKISLLMLCWIKHTYI